MARTKASEAHKRDAEAASLDDDDAVVLDDADADDVAEEEDNDDDEQQQQQGCSKQKKRPRTGRGSEPSPQPAVAAAYPRGTVKQVRVCNFMTYGEPAVTITPGPRLNLVLGPNGTGKSSLVCALCVGLGGSTKLLGRADSVKDFIRRGADSGWVETTLSGGGGGRRDVVVRCDMRKQRRDRPAAAGDGDAVTTTDGYATEWRLNGAPATKRDVVELVRTLNIQFDNLCQFLPQDRVVEFARLNPNELLVATEKAIGDATLHAQHMLLVDKRVEAKNQEAAKQGVERRHEQLVAENQRLERDYRRFKARRQLQERAALLRCKAAWLGVKAKEEAAKEAKAAKAAADAALRAAQGEVRADDGPAQRRAAEAEAAKKAAAQLAAAVKREQRAAQQAMEALQKEEEAARAARERVGGLAAQSQKLRAEVEKLRASLARGKAGLAALPPPPDNSAGVARVDAELQRLREELYAHELEQREVAEDVNTARLEGGRVAAEILRCESARVQRVQRLTDATRQFGHRAAMDWMDARRREGLFRGDVAGPLAAEVSVRVPAAAAALESVLFRHLPNYACTNQHDADLLMAEFQRNNLRSTVVVVAPEELARALPSRAAELRARGIPVLCTLDEAYDAPPLVKHALANVASLDQVVVLEADDFDAVRTLLYDCGAPRALTPTSEYAFLPSAHGGREDAGVQTSKLWPSRILAGGAAVDERKQQLEARNTELRRRVAELEARGRAAAAKAAPLKEQVAALEGERAALTDEVTQAHSKRSKLAQVARTIEAVLRQKEAAPDPLASAPALEQQLRASLERHHAALKQQLAAATAAWRLLQEHAAAELRYRELDMQARGLAEAADARRAALGSFQAAADRAAARARQAEQLHRMAEREARDEHPMDDPDKLRQMRELPSTIAELEAEAAEADAKVAEISVANPRVVDEYRGRQREIAALQAQLTSMAASLAAVNEEMDEVRAAWLPELQRVVGLVNASFGANFAEIGCAGEVLLRQHDDYDRFAIEIRVKFREAEEMRLLTAHRQSGGERSVSTILYLIALQGVTVTPFRVVDEINQGMDPVNERKVFVQLVEASCRPGTPQCFLLTPKLLPDLPFAEDVTVLNIFNGGLVDGAAAGRYSAAALLGARGLAALPPALRVF